MDNKSITSHMRHKLFRRTLQEIGKATRWEKMALVLPFLVLVLDAHIFYYAAYHHVHAAITVASGFVLILSVLEIFACLKEIHAYVSSTARQACLEETIREIIQELGDPQVREVVAKVMKRCPDEGYGRSEIYRCACKILDEKRY